MSNDHETGDIGRERLMVSRRRLLSASASTAAGLAIATGDGAEAQALRPVDPRAPVEVELNVNGRTHRLDLDARVNLLDALRHHLGLTGSKKGCDHGQCGACTVLSGGRRTLSCLTLAVMVREPVVTIEGLAAPGGTLHPMQQAFIDQDAFQCGYCTPGQILSAVACVEEGHADTPEAIREYMSGNLCRCAAYPHIVAAIEQARPRMAKA
jgi:xanthine dehydrogenase YagT iron-sulfur-binding subunit